MRPRSLPVDPVSYPITTAARGKEGGRRGVGWGCRGSWWELYREYRKREKKKEYSGVCLNLFRRMQHVSVAEVNTHACHHRFRKRKVVAKKKKKKVFFLSAASRENVCARQVKISACEEFSVKCKRMRSMRSVCGLQIQLCIHISLRTV